MKLSGAAVAAPTFGPAIVTAFGVDIPILALALSVIGLVLARFIAPPPLRKLTFRQEVALTALLLIILFLIVTGEFPIIGGGHPIGAGMAVMWGIGLGFSGMLAIEFFGNRAMAMLRAAFGKDASGAE
ncbi:hypothetical protein [Sphingomonas pituitosa]|uniref:hypothetical protein n=1 Tax=Sphingomonas pituitosa TaxID=99597 RepID=UPI00082B4F9E|nr:hypothetical protein [Sphingomonas pituitosa]